VSDPEAPATGAGSDDPAAQRRPGPSPQPGSNTHDSHGPHVDADRTPRGDTAGARTAADSLVRVENLIKYFPLRGGILQRTVAEVKAVDDVSFDIRRGEVMGLVGESGCGKTTTGRLLLRLIEPTKGRVDFEGRDLTQMKSDDLKRVRSDMQIVFQDPYASLNPRLPIGEIIGEGLANQGVRNRHQREERVAAILEKVGLRRYYINRYPHEFSGGQRQRIGLARALVLNPKFVVADEPVSALDVSIQSQVLNLMADLKDEFGLTYLFISHNLSVVEHISDRVGVMYLGKLVELADTEELFRNPKHPYTQFLLSAIPKADPKQRRNRMILTGDVPSPINPPTGCRFHTRCPIARFPICSEELPKFELKANGHWAACHFADETEKLKTLKGVVRPALDRQGTPAAEKVEREEAAQEPEDVLEGERAEHEHRRHDEPLGGE
jgi:peptide/nickel transport system ATP-binding protein/oligopeptide transport system ATP-binding protein